MNMGAVPPLTTESPEVSRRATPKIVPLRARRARITSAIFLKELVLQGWQAYAGPHAFGAHHAGHRMGPGFRCASACLWSGSWRMRAKRIPEHGKQRDRPVAWPDEFAGRRAASGQSGEIRT